MASKAEDVYVQEACLGRVKAARGKKISYLIKWVGWDKVQDITCEPAGNVKVLKVETPLLEQGAPKFQEELENLLAEYLKSKARREEEEDEEDDVVEATSLNQEDAAEESEDVATKKRGGSDGETSEAKRQRGRPKQPKQVTRQCPTANENITLPGCLNALANTTTATGQSCTVTESTYSVTQRQFLLIDHPHVIHEGDLSAVFMHLKDAAMNAGLCWTTMDNLRGPGSSTVGAILSGSVDHMSKGAGFGWFQNEKSGVSLQGRRQADHHKYNCLRFGTGDTIGIVVHTKAEVAYCVRNGKTVFRIAVPAAADLPMQFALHLCPGDEVTLCSSPAKLETLVDNNAPIVEPFDPQTA